MSKELDAIHRAIPHRPPFLFIDRVLEMSVDHAIAERYIREDEPHFAGHYPGNPIMPGVLLCEACFQTAAICIVERFGALEREGQEPLTPILARIGDAKFKQMVKPGDTIKIEVTYKQSISQFHFLKAKVTKSGKLCMSVEFALAMIDESAK